jgi:cold shock CspA family protein
LLSSLSKSIIFQVIGKKLANIRSKGTLSKWIDDKGFGFLTPEKGKKEIFVHISAFDRNIPRRPIVGDIIFYHTKIDENGKSKAYDAAIEGLAPIDKKVPSRPKKHYKEHQAKNSWGIFILCIALLIGAGGTIFNHFKSGTVQRVSTGTQHSNTSNSLRYTCAGKTHCNQMRSCEEAMFYMQNCTGTTMDGDGDGVPCESQWCN